jgi:hypothetical protein
MRIDKMKWIFVDERLPVCDKKPNSLGVPVLIHPRVPAGYEHCGIDGTAYYGCRITKKPTFYKHGAAIVGVEAWQPLPEPPCEK